jgi:hypothetical protein
VSLIGSVVEDGISLVSQRGFFIYDKVRDPTEVRSGEEFRGITSEHHAPTTLFYHVFWDCVYRIFNHLCSNGKWCNYVYKELMNRLVRSCINITMHENLALVINEVIGHGVSNEMCGVNANGGLEYFSDWHFLLPLVLQPVGCECLVSVG